MQSRNGYLSALIKNARRHRNLSMVQVYSGICSVAAYARFESGDFDVNIHIRGAIMQRLGIDEKRSGMCINSKEYEQLDDREHLLENIGMRDYAVAAKSLEQYKNKYDMKNHLNRQFTDYVEARLEYIFGNKKKSLKLYERAIEYTMPRYEKNDDIVCMSVYEAYIICEIAAISAELGDSVRAKRLYTKLMKKCEDSTMDRWIKGRIYPKAVSGILRITELSELDKNTLEIYFNICDDAVECLRKTRRLYFLRELLIYRNSLCVYSGRDSQKEYAKLLECLDDLYAQYDIHEQDYEWYPYYINGIFYPVDKVVNERRILYGMTVEKLAGTELDAGTISRIINGKNMPRRNTIDMLFKKLGVEGVQYSDKVVSKDVRANELWDDFVDALTHRNIALCEDIYSKLKNMLDMNIYINKTVIDWVRIKLDVCKKELDYAGAIKKYRDNFERIITNADKITYCTVVENEIIGNYIDCLSNINNRECVDMLRRMYNKLPADIVERKRTVMFTESMLRRFSSCSGNLGEYEESCKLAEEGVALELSCGRACVVGSFLYSIAWNNAQKGTISQDDIKKCNYSCLFAWFMGNDMLQKFYHNKAEDYKRMYDEISHS